jgi:hypothetical protein
LGATFLAANSMFHARTKYIELNFHFVREKLAAKQLAISFLCSADQIVDILTKSLAKSCFTTISNKLTVFEKSLRLRGAVEDKKMDNANSDKTGELKPTVVTNFS